MRGPIRRSSEDHYTPPIDEFRSYQDSPSYYEYAKDLCKHYTKDLDLVRLCAIEKKYIGISKRDFEKMYEDVMFLRDSLKTVLKKYRGFFNEHYVQNISIRQYGSTQHEPGKRRAYIRKRNRI